MRYIKFLFLSTFLVVNLTYNVNAQCNDSLYRYSDGIFVEPMCRELYNDYNWDNTIYTKGKKFYYKYTLLKDRKKLFFNFISDRDWTLTDTIVSKTVEGIRVQILEGLEPFIKYDSSYSQTVMRMDYLTPSGIPNYERTGIVENKKNVWLHPPRSSFFKILEINPFPFIQEPYEVGNKWKWKLAIGDLWSDPRWCLWKGQIINECEYEITELTELTTQLGILPCIVVNSKAKSSIGSTYLKSYFNKKYGFIRYEYTNIDGSELVFDLWKVEH